MKMKNQLVNLALSLHVREFDKALALLENIDKHLIPNLKNLKIALADKKLWSREVFTEAIDYHIKLLSSYILQDIIQQELNIIETVKGIISSNNISELTKLNQLKQQLHKVQSIDSIPYLDIDFKQQDFATPISEYANKLRKFNKQLCKMVSSTVEYILINNLPREKSTFQLAYTISNSASHPEYYIKSKLMHDYGEQFLVRETSNHNDNNLEIMLESAADLITRKTFSDLAIQTKIFNSSFIQDKNNKNIIIKSKHVQGKDMKKYLCNPENDLSKIENYEDFISQSLILLNPYTINRDTLIFDHKIIKMDHNKIGFLDFNNVDQVHLHITQTFIYNSYWKALTPYFKMEKLVVSLINNLNRVDIDHLYNSFLIIGKEFNTFPVYIPYTNNDSIRIHLHKSKVEDYNTFAKQISNHYMINHDILRAYATNMAIAQNLQIDGKDPISYFRQSGNEKFLDAYKKYPLSAKIIENVTMLKRLKKVQQLRGDNFKHWLTSDNANAQDANIIDQFDKELREYLVQENIFDRFTYALQQLSSNPNEMEQFLNYYINVNKYFKDSLPKIEQVLQRFENYLENSRIINYLSALKVNHNSLGKWLLTNNTCEQHKLVMQKFTSDLTPVINLTENHHQFTEAHDIIITEPQVMICFLNANKAVKDYFISNMSLIEEILQAYNNYSKCVTVNEELIAFQKLNPMYLCIDYQTAVSKLSNELTTMLNTSDVYNQYLEANNEIRTNPMKMVNFLNSNQTVANYLKNNLSKVEAIKQQFSNALENQHSI